MVIIGFTIPGAAIFTAEKIVNDQEGSMIFLSLKAAITEKLATEMFLSGAAASITFLCAGIKAGTQNNYICQRGRYRKRHLCKHRKGLLWNYIVQLFRKVL